MLGGWQWSESVNPLIGTKEIDQIVARPDRFDPECEKVVLAMGCSLHLA
jgi:hypothetical protein